MPVTLQNCTRQMQVFNLAHDAYCKDECVCADTTMMVIAENPRNGERAPRLLARKTSSSLTLLAGERRPGLPTVLLDVPEVKAAIARGRLRVVEQTPDKPARPAASGKSSQSAAEPAQKEKEK